MDILNPDPKVLLELIAAKMPFGKYAGRPLSNIPEAYYIWFRERGYPPGKLGEQMAMMLEIKAHGLETLLWEIERRMDPLGASFK